MPFTSDRQPGRRVRETAVTVGPGIAAAHSAAERASPPELARGRASLRADHPVRHLTGRQASRDEWRPYQAVLRADRGVASIHRERTYR